MMMCLDVCMCGHMRTHMYVSLSHGVVQCVIVRLLEVKCCNL